MLLFVILSQREEGSAAGKPIEIDDCSSDLDDPSFSDFTVIARSSAMAAHLHTS